VAGVYLLQTRGILQNCRQLPGVQGQFGFAQPQSGQFGHMADLIDRQVHLQTPDSKTQTAKPRQQNPDNKTQTTKNVVASKFHDVW
jgi:hypothetical protein